MPWAVYDVDGSDGWLASGGLLRACKLDLRLPGGGVVASSNPPCCLKRRVHLRVVEGAQKELACELSLIAIIGRLTYYHPVGEYGGVLRDWLALLLTSVAGDGHGVPAPTTRRDAATPMAIGDSRRAK